MGLQGSESVRCKQSKSERHRAHCSTYLSEIARKSELEMSKGFSRNMHSSGSGSNGNWRSVLQGRERTNDWLPSECRTFCPSLVSFCSMVAGVIYELIIPFPRPARRFARGVTFGVACVVLHSLPSFSSSVVSCAAVRALPR